MLKFIVCGALVFSTATVSLADERSAPHAGQMDTDGILSPGEVPNPNIDYDKAQRHGERRGDERYENPYNDSVAATDEEAKRREREREDYEREERDRHQWWRFW